MRWEHNRGGLFWLGAGLLRRGYSTARPRERSLLASGDEGIKELKGEDNRSR